MIQHRYNCKLFLYVCDNLLLINFIQKKKKINPYSVNLFDSKSRYLIVCDSISLIKFSTLE